MTRSAAQAEFFWMAYTVVIKRSAEKELAAYSQRAQPVTRARIIRKNGGNNEETMAMGHFLRIGPPSIVLGAPASSRPGGQSPP